MKARIEKKLSNRLTQIAPSQFPRSWVDKVVSELAWKQRTRVSQIRSVGGGTDYWGEGMDAYTVWADWRMNWYWHGPFKSYPEGHEYEGCPDTGTFRPTTRNLLRLAADCERARRGKDGAR
ncbi:hypothetical protein [Pseudomonas sp. UBA6310]|uniref:hypothetical protein n=1 Tax=Pseudomonas sp. UBA6310 TaxID=1947327 RepID=UPI00257DE675|nr:hypothetical protein [Pseudomonas sp. UBA6310]